MRTDETIAFDHLLREFRADIATVVMQIDAICSGLAGELNELQGRWLAKPMRDCRRVISVIDDLRDLIRLEKGDYEGKRCDTNVMALVRAFSEEMAEAARQRRAVFLVEASEPLPKARIDADLLMRVLRRIGRALTECARPMDEIKAYVTVSDDGGMLIVDVFAPGTELPREMLDTVFDRAKQAQVGLKLGRGYSMLFSRTAARFMGGDLRLAPWPGRGTRVTLKVALA